jgi:hypothetical protein
VTLIQGVVGGLKIKMCIISSKLGVTRMVIIALVVIIAAGGVMAAYISFKLTPNPSPMPKTHTVAWATMANYVTDLWNVTADSDYQVTLNDTMTVPSGNQYLEIDARNSTDNSAYIWAVWFKNATYFTYTTYIPGQFSNPQDFGGLNCNNGIVTITVTRTSITFVGSSSFTSYVSFRNLAQIETQNGDGNFNGGELNIEVH